jgi:hypothetical protein
MKNPLEIRCAGESKTSLEAALADTRHIDTAVLLTVRHHTQNARTFAGNPRRKR